jgi:hypothetical protein
MKTNLNPDTDYDSLNLIAQGLKIKLPESKFYYFLSEFGQWNNISSVKREWQYQPGCDKKKIK